MSKDTINPKRYTVVEKLGKDLKEGDVYWSTLTYSWIKHKPHPDDDCEAATFLVRVPSSPVMSEEDFYNSLTPTEINLAKKAPLSLAYQKYLIGTRSIVPEKMSDQQIKKEAVKYLNEVCDVVFSEDKMEFAIHMVNFYRNWLRNQK